MKLRLWPVVITALVLPRVQSPAWAGGPLFVSPEGLPYRWDAAQPVRYRVDPGPLGARSHAAAVALLERAVATWQAVPTARLRFEAAGELPEHVTGATLMPFLNRLRAGEPCPILFDQDGSIFAQLGVPDSRGIAIPYRVEFQSGRILVGFVALNGRLLSSYRDGFALRTATHELGHLANLEHSQINPEVTYDGDPTNDYLAPVMSYSRGPNSNNQLHQDEQAWFSWLYPRSGFIERTGALQGRVLLPDGKTGLAGINVIARRVDDPHATAVSCLSGYLDRDIPRRTRDPARLGDFLLPGLPPGTYTLEIQQFRLPPEIRGRGYLIGGPKFWCEGSCPQDSPARATPIVVNAGQTVKSLDVVINARDLGAPREVGPQPGGTPPGPPLPGGALQPVTLPVRISGRVADGFSPDRRFKALLPNQVKDALPTLLAALQAVYSVTLEEPTTVTAILSAARTGTDLDLYLLGQSEEHGQVQWWLQSFSNDEGTPPELVQLRLEKGRYFFGVHRAGWQGGDYTLTLLGAPAPLPDNLPAAAIAFLLLGDITPTSAALRWQTTGETPSVAYYNQPWQEVGDPAREQEHALRLTALPPGTETRVRVFAASAGEVDQITVPLAAAVPAAPEGLPDLNVEPLGPQTEGGRVLVGVAVANRGAGATRQVRIEQWQLPEGWEVIPGAAVPPSVELGEIGAHGRGLFLLRVQQRSGTAPASLTVHGSYTDATGTPRRF